MTISECVRAVFKENAERLLNKKDYNMFAEELRRMQNYDSEVCPERWKPAITYLKKHGWDSPELLKRFGERQFKFNSKDELERLIRIYNFAIKNNAKYGLDGKARARVEILLEDYGFEKKEMDMLKKKSRIGGAFKYNESDEKTRFSTWSGDGEIFTIDDAIKGFSVLFCSRNKPEKYEAYLFGIPKEIDLRLDQVWGGTVKEPRVFLIGQVNIHELATIGNRRFMYIFGMQPAAEKDIIETLVKLNKLPAQGSGKGYNKVSYSLEEKDISQLNPPKAVSLIYDEALAAKEQRLFADVKVFELVMKKEEIKKDPVVIGFDHLGNMHPLIYWAGDSKKTTE